MKNTCGTCKYFGARIGSSDESGEYLEAPLTAKIPYAVAVTYHKCELLQQREHPPPAAFPVDGSGYYAAFCVLEEFGCNQWEPK